MSNFGELLRYWRKTNGMSQMELGLTANTSSKHISFLETGRAKPSREMVLQLSQAMNIPLNERNMLLTASGFAEAFSRIGIEEPAMQSVHHALTILLENHEPYPALVFDWDWNIVMANQTHHQMFSLIAEQQLNFPQTDNILELLFDPNGFRPFIENWEEIALILLHRIQRERMIRQNRTSDLLNRLMSYPDIPKDWNTSSYSDHGEPMAHIILKLGALRLKLFSTIATFGTAIDVTMQELMIEHYFPVDQTTRDFFLKQQGHSGSH